MNNNTTKILHVQVSYRVLVGGFNPSKKRTVHQPFQMLVKMNHVNQNGHPGLTFAANLSPFAANHPAIFGPRTLSHKWPKWCTTRSRSPKDMPARSSHDASFHSTGNRTRMNYQESTTSSNYITVMKSLHMDVYSNNKRVRDTVCYIQCLKIIHQVINHWQRHKPHLDAPRMGQQQSPIDPVGSRCINVWPSNGQQHGLGHAHKKGKASNRTHIQHPIANLQSDP